MNLFVPNVNRSLRRWSNLRGQSLQLSVLSAHPGKYIKNSRFSVSLQEKHLPGQVPLTRRDFRVEEDVVAECAPATKLFITPDFSVTAPPSHLCTTLMG
jgi:hypothetical protein